MQQICFRDGRIETEEAPAPSPLEGEVLVGIARSCLTAPFSIVSASGVVLETGAGVDELFVGERVACIAPEGTPQAALLSLPKDGVVPAPHEVGLDITAVSGYGAVALQGVRRAEPTLGECFVVAGLGLIGQLTAQLLKVSGCRVIGCDRNPDRIRLACKLGMDQGFVIGADSPAEAIHRITGDVGADGIIVTAGIPKDALSALLRMCRAGARVVIAGGATVDVPFLDEYRKECDISISVNGGPGLESQTPEGKAVDYPISYVRWTGSRNLKEFLALAADGSIRVEPLLGNVYPVDRAADAYEAAKSDSEVTSSVLLSYPGLSSEDLTAQKMSDPPVRKVQVKTVRVAVAGAGSFVKAMHLPNIGKQAALFTLRAVQSRTPDNAETTARKFGAEYSTTDFRRILDDNSIDAVFITTRHNLHAGMTMEALRAGRHVFVEKPLAVTAGEFGDIRRLFETAGESESPLLMTGFNRRFSPVIRRIRELTVNRANPMILNYRMNAGFIPFDHWVHTVEGGGRNIGEACHIYDLFTFLVDAGFQGVEAKSIQPSSDTFGSRDNFTATVAFAEGSLATLTYTALGSPDYPKEQLEVFCDGMVLVMDDYKTLTCYGIGDDSISGPVNKGHSEELMAFAGALLNGGPWPIPLWQQYQAMDIAFEVERLLGG